MIQLQFTHSDGDGYIIARITDRRGNTHDVRLTLREADEAKESLFQAISDEWPEKENV